MVRAMLNERQAKVLMLLLDGRSIKGVIDSLGVAQRTIYDDKDKLEAQGFIREVPGCRSPRSYDKGPRYSVAFELMKSSNFLSTSDGRGVVRRSLSGVRVTQAHTQDSVRFLVTHQGDMPFFYVHDEYGIDKKVTLFSKRPNPDDGYESYNCPLDWDGLKVSIGYRDTIRRYLGKKSSYQGTLLVFPPRLELTASDLEAQPASYYFIGYVSGITNYLSKYAGWTFDEPTHSDQRIEYAFLDEDLTKNLPKNALLHSDPKVWTDRSTGKVELETDSRDVAIKLLRLPPGEWSWSEIANTVGLDAHT